MPVKKRRLRQLKGRIVKCTSTDHFEKLKSKYNDRLLFVHFLKGTNLACKRMSAYLSEVSRKSEYSHVMFVEVDLDQVKDAIKLYDVKGLPGVQCWKNGQLQLNTVLTQSLYIIEALNKYAGERPASGWWVNVLKAVLAGAVAAGGWFAYSTLSSSARQWELDSIERQISAAQQLVSDGKRRRKKSKDIRAAKKKLDMLQQRKQDLLRKSSTTPGAAASTEDGLYSDDQDLHVEHAAAADAAPLPVNFSDDDDEEE